MKTRTITAIILIAITIPLIALGGIWTVLFVCAIVAGGVIEVLKVRGIRWPKVIYFIAIAGTLGALLWVFIVDFINDPSGFVAMLKDSGAFLTYQKNFMIRTNIVYIAIYLTILLLVETVSSRFNVSDVFYIFTLSIFLSIAGQSLIFLRFHSLETIGYIFIATYACDTFALLCGKYFGKHKLAPITSPKKTWEGAIGGVTMSMVFSIVCFLIFPFKIGDISGGWIYLVIFVISLFLGIGAVIGDLIFSSIKRHFGIKDFGAIFPGHGGILDRVDSLLFNLMIFIALYACMTGGALFLN